MIFEIVHGRTFFSLASYLFSLVQGFMYCVQYMKPCVQYFSIIFFVLHIISSAVYEKNRYTMYHGMNMENINDWGECHCSCSFVASGQKCLISYLKDISGLTHLRFFCFFFVPWLHYRIKGKMNSTLILESYSHLSESFSAFC